MIQQFHFWLSTQKNFESNVLKRYLNIYVHSIIIIIILKRQTQPTCPWRGAWNRYSARTMECYSVLKSKGILTRAVTWMDLEDIMLTLIIKRQNLYDSIYPRDPQ